MLLQQIKNKFRYEAAPFYFSKKEQSDKVIYHQDSCYKLFCLADMPENTALVTADAGDAQDNLAAGEGGGAVEADSAQRSNQLCSVSLENHRLILSAKH